APLFVRLSALGYGPAVDDLRSAVPQRDGETQYPGRQRQAALQSRADPVRDQDQTPRGARRCAIGTGGDRPPAIGIELGEEFVWIRRIFATFRWPKSKPGRSFDEPITRRSISGTKSS